MSRTNRPTVNGRRRRVHVHIAEKILGRPLKGEEQVHHVNFNEEDDRHENLVICPNRAYHKLLHRRTEALNACGNANYIKCSFCQQYDDPKNLMNVNKQRPNGWWLHRGCMAQRHIAYVAKRSQV